MEYDTNCPNNYTKILNGNLKIYLGSCVLTGHRGARCSCVITLVSQVGFILADVHAAADRQYQKGSATA